MSEKNQFWIKLCGHSMSPILKDQDNIFIKPIKPDELNIGDVILFIDQESRELTLHRLIGFPLITKGDYSLIYESNPIENLIGKALAFEREACLYPVLNSRLLLACSKLRLSNKAGRFLGLIGFLIYSAITKLSRNKVPQLDDPLSRAL